MQFMTDTSLIKALREGDHVKAIDVLYEGTFTSILRYVQRNSGTVADAEDVFQDAMLILLDKSKQEGFLLTASVKTYLFAVSRNIWLKRLRERAKFAVDTDIAELPLTDDDSLACQVEREDSLISWLNQIPVHCRRLLHTIFYLGEPMDNVMRIFGYGTRHSADNQKYKCLQKVRAAAQE